MQLSVDLLKWELQDAIDAGSSAEYIDDLRAAIMLLNRNLFHQKIMGADPNNKYYASKA